MLKLGIITGFLGQTKDRFHLYNQPKSLDEKFQLMAQIPGYDGVEIVYPYEVPGVEETKAALAAHGLKVAAVNVNVKAEPEFVNGGITSPDPGVRAKAVRFIKEAKDFAQAIGGDKVTCCPLGDGFEFAFQYDYQKVWTWLADCFGEAGAHNPDIPLFIEYKPSETRGQCFLDNAAKTMCLLNDMQTPNMGVTIDFGHSAYSSEYPPEAASMLADSKYLYYVHINDNDGKWDWDYFCGSKHYLEYVEFLWQLKVNGYDDYLTSDTSPTRWDIKGTFEVNSRITNRIWKLLDTLEAKGFKDMVGQSDYLKTWKFIEENIFGLKD
jgi:xylose isomerase